MCALVTAPPKGEPSISIRSKHEQHRDKKRTRRTALSSFTPEQLREFIDGWQTFHHHNNPSAEQIADGAKEYWIDMIFDIDDTKYIIDFPPGTQWVQNPENPDDPQDLVPDHALTFLPYNP